LGLPRQKILPARALNSSRGRGAHVAASSATVAARGRTYQVQGTSISVKASALA